MLRKDLRSLSSFLLFPPFLLTRSCHASSLSRWTPQALGMGSGALFALYHLLARDATHFATPVHLMQAVWATSVCLCNAQVAGILPRPETSVGAAGEKITPFVFLTGAQAAVHALALLLNASSAPFQTPKKKKKRSR